MTSFKEQLTLQATEIDELQRMIRNYRADGPSRKTIRYLEDKKKTFAELFNTIKNNHAVLTKNKPNDDQEYFKRGTFDSLKKLYESTQENIAQRLKETIAGTSLDAGRWTSTKA